MERKYLKENHLMIKFVYASLSKNIIRRKTMNLINIRKTKDGNKK